jgi:hypothetical protein
MRLNRLQSVSAALIYSVLPLLLCVHPVSAQSTAAAVPVASSACRIAAIGRGTKQQSASSSLKRQPNPVRVVRT